MLGTADTDIDEPITRKEAAEEFRQMSGVNCTSQEYSKSQVSKGALKCPPCLLPEEAKLRSLELAINGKSRGPINPDILVREIMSQADASFFTRACQHSGSPRYTGAIFIACTLVAECEKTDVKKARWYDNALILLTKNYDVRGIPVMNVGGSVAVITDQMITGILMDSTGPRARLQLPLSEDAYNCLVHLTRRDITKASVADGPPWKVPSPKCSMGPN